jgi:hypothetical protein
LKDGAERVGNDSNNDGGEGCERGAAPFGKLASSGDGAEKGKNGKLKTDSDFILLGETGAGRGERGKIGRKIGRNSSSFRERRVV